MAVVLKKRDCVLQADTGVRNSDASSRGGDSYRLASWREKKSLRTKRRNITLAQWQE